MAKPVVDILADALLFPLDSAKELFLQPPTFDGSGQNICSRLKKINIDAGEFPPLRCVCAENAVVGSATRTDDHIHSADHTMIPHQCRRAEPRFGAQVCDDHRRAREQSKSLLRITLCGHRFAHYESFSPARARAKQQSLIPRQQFEYAAKFDAKNSRHERNRVTEQPIEVFALKCAPSQIGEGALLTTSE